MGIIQNPPQSALVKKQNSYKTFTKDNVSDSWPATPNERFICTSISEGRGLVHSTASFQFIGEDMADTEGLNNMRTEFAMASGLILTGEAGFNFVYKTRFVLVVEEQSSGDVPKFMGCLTGVSYSVKSGTNGKYDSIDGFTAMGVDWMLSQVHLIGGYFMGISDTGDVDGNGTPTQKHTSFIPPSFNIGGQGNKSILNTYDVESAGVNIGIFNYSNNSLTSQEDDYQNSRWNVDLASKYILYQLGYNKPRDDFSVPFDCYEWYREMFTIQEELEFDGGADDSVFDTDAQYMNDVPVSIIPVWDLLVQLVEGSGKSTLTIRYVVDAGESFARIVVVN